MQLGWFTMNTSNFAELRTDRMITDIGPGCPDCGSPDDQGMWLYLVPTASDWVIVARCRDDLGTIMAMCACCHRAEHFDVYPEDAATVERVRGLHAIARKVKSTHGVTPGRK